MEGGVSTVTKFALYPASKASRKVANFSENKLISLEEYKGRRDLMHKNPESSIYMDVLLLRSIF